MAETITTVPLTHLRESPFNPRKSFSEAAMQELSISIAALGVMQPIVARTLPTAQQDIWVRHEIVFGHRRFRAAALAGLAEVPVILRDMTSEQAAIAQVHENIQRQDVTALEEADSFKHLHKTHNMTADTIAAAVGKSRSYVYGRLKLATVAPEVREAVTDDGLGAEIALEVARLVDHTLQRKALKDLRKYSTEWPSYRNAKQQLQGMFDCDTEQALFDPADASLAKLAGACTACPKRAGNDPDLQGVLAPGVCTDRGCFGAKTREHNRLELVVLGSQGHPVVAGNAAAQLLPHKHSQPSGYVSLNAGNWIGDKHMRYSEMLATMAERGDEVPKTTLVEADGGMEIKSFLTAEQAEAVEKLFLGTDDDDDDAGTGGQSTAARAASGGGFGSVGRDEALASWTAAERVAIDPGQWLLVRRAALAALRRAPRTTDELRALLLREYDMADGFGLMADMMGLDAELEAAELAADEAGESFGVRAWWVERFARMGADDLGALAAGMAVDQAMGAGVGYWHQPGSRERAAERVALASRYGVNVEGMAASRPDQMDEAGVAGGGAASTGAQLDAFAVATA
jgi:ParB/RepB/Spo0J family partition protein